MEDPVDTAGFEGIQLKDSDPSTNMLEKLKAGLNRSSDSQFDENNRRKIQLVNCLESFLNTDPPFEQSENHREYTATRLKTFFHSLDFKYTEGKNNESLTIKSFEDLQSLPNRIIWTARGTENEYI